MGNYQRDNEEGEEKMPEVGASWQETTMRRRRGQKNEERGEEKDGDDDDDDEDELGNNWKQKDNTFRICIGKRRIQVNGRKR